MELVALDGGVISAMKNTQFAVTAGVVLLVLLAVNIVAGCMNALQLLVGCFRCCRFCCRFCCKFVVAVMLKRALPPKVQMVNKKVQSPTTYTLKSSAPRFKPLAEWESGAWDD
jgi:hypothetical protein